MEKNNKKTLIAVGAVVVIAIVAIIVCVSLNHSKGKVAAGAPDEINGNYTMAIPTGEDFNDTTFTLAFDNEKKTFQEEIGGLENPVALNSGTYTYDGSVVKTKSENGDEQDYIPEGQYLIVDNYFYKGDIPEGKTFKASCEYVDKYGITTTVNFKEDGTYEEVTVDTQSTEADNQTSTTGTYEREGDIITRTADSGSSLIDFLIYNGEITNSYYILEK